jgi:hypothetical protein
MGAVFWWESQKEGNNLEHVGMVRKIILKKDLRETGWDGMDLSHLA